MIPKILHQIWVGPEPFPKEFGAYQQSWRRHHPQWTFHFWTEETLPSNLLRNEAYDQSRIPAERSDMIRIELLWEYGGVYVDTDMECMRPIDPLLDEVEAFAVYLKPGRVTNTVLGSKPGHPLFARARREMRPQTIGARFDKAASGPYFLDALFKRHHNVAIFPPELFFPASLEERERAYAVHHSSRSWKSREEWRETALLAEERLAHALAKLHEERQAHETTQRENNLLRVKIGLLKDRLAGEDAPPDERKDVNTSLESFERGRHRRRALSFLRTRN